MLSLAYLYFPPPPLFFSFLFYLCTLYEHTLLPLAWVCAWPPRYCQWPCARQWKRYRSSLAVTAAGAARARAVRTVEQYEEKSARRGQMPVDSWQTKSDRSRNLECVTSPLGFLGGGGFGVLHFTLVRSAIKSQNTEHRTQSIDLRMGVQEHRSHYKDPRSQTCRFKNTDRALHSLARYKGVTRFGSLFLLLCRRRRRHNKEHRKQTTYRRVYITDHTLYIANQRSKIADHRSQITDRESQITDRKPDRLQIIQPGSVPRCNNVGLMFYSIERGGFTARSTKHRTQSAIRWSHDQLDVASDVCGILCFTLKALQRSQNTNNKL